MTTRGEGNLRHLMAAAKPYRSLFYFATLDSLMSVDFFTEASWALPNDKSRPIAVGKASISEPRWTSRERAT